MERRSYLRAVCGTGALALAGCIDALDGTGEPPTDDPDPDEPTPSLGDDSTPTPEDGTTLDDETSTPDEETPTPDGSESDDEATPTPDDSTSEETGTPGDSADVDSSRTLSIYAYPGNEPARYEFTVSGELEQTDAYGATVDDHDTVDGSTATGHVWGMMDSYRFTGAVTEFDVSRRVKVVVDGDEVDPGNLGTVTGYALSQ